MSKERFDCLYNDCVVRGAWEDGDCIESQIQANKTGFPILAKDHPMPSCYVQG